MSEVKPRKLTVCICCKCIIVSKRHLFRLLASCWTMCLLPTKHCANICRLCN